MRTGVVQLGFGLAVLLSCCGEDSVVLTPTEALGGASGSAGGDLGRGSGGVGSQGGTAGSQGPPSQDAGTDPDAGTGGLSDGGVPDASGSGAGGPVVVRLDMGTLTVFDLPIGSVRYAAAGYDPGTRVCASIIWDFSNNDLEVERRCGDFLAYPNPISGEFISDFPYVLVEPNRDAPCYQLWGYGGFTPTAASGCIDPFEQLVDARVEVRIDGVDYVIYASTGSLP
jgi:hypothetical protein